MQLFHSATSPFVRKVMVVAGIHGLTDRITCLPANADPVAADAGIVARNPLGQVPTLVTGDGRVLADSRVICEYLDHLGGATLFPRDATRWAVLAAQSLADGLMDAALLCRYETSARPAPLRWPEWERGQMRKIIDALATMAAEAPTLADRLDIGTISYGCALGYLDFRFAGLDWRAAHPALAAWFAAFDARPEMRATRPRNPAPAGGSGG